MSVTNLQVNPATQDIVLYLNEGVPGSVTLDGVQTLTNKTMASAKLTTGLLDVNGNELLLVPQVANAVNELSLSNAPAGGYPSLAATGSDADIDFALIAKGAGRIRLGKVLLTGPVVDANGNELLKVSTTASAVNELTVTNAATANAPTLSATGDDANIDLNLAPKGTGTVKAGGATVLVLGGALGQPSSADLSNCTADGANQVGAKNVPQNSQSVAYTLVLSDAGKHILHPSADTTARTFNIPANASVAYPIGTAITFINQNAAGVLTIAINTDTLRLAGAGLTGSRTLAANGIATAVKVASTEWIISGTNLT